MNNRDCKAFAPLTMWHIFNRGNGKMKIFKDDQDFRNFKKRMILLLKPELVSMVPIDTIDRSKKRERIRLKPLPKRALNLISYSLMPTHFHFQLFQNSEVTPDKFIHSLCSSYGKYFNKKYGHVGGLYQDQFKAVLVKSDNQSLHLSAYIHLNSKRAGIVTDFKDYKWSSYREYAGLEEGLCQKDVILDHFSSSREYEDYCLECDNSVSMGTIDTGV